MALELASYDLMPSEVPGFAKGFTAALFATSLCYPLDTVRWVTSMLLNCEQSCETPEVLSLYTPCHLRSHCQSFRHLFNQTACSCRDLHKRLALPHSILRSSAGHFAILFKKAGAGMQAADPVAECRRAGCAAGLSEHHPKGWRTWPI